jgi:crotonobetainyl-CoA:carnitine CoA-transferase CaiB-like acyl-CoA transferase
VTELPLSDLRVVDLSWVVAGPAVGRVLADYGAEVVRVESSTRLDTSRLIGPFHGGTQTPESSVLYGDVNAGKLGLTLNLKLEPARHVVRDLVRRSDVVIESFSPGVMERWGLGYERLRALNESVIMLSTSLMGQTGPYGGFAGYGNIGGAMSGFQSLVGWPGRPPLGPYGPYSDYVAPRFALVLLLAALDRRARTGEGCYIDVSQTEAAIQFLAPQIADHAATGRIAEAAGNRDPAAAPHGVYPCVDDASDVGGSWVAIAVRDDDEWRALAKLMEIRADDRFATTKGRLARTDELDDLVGAWTATRTAADVEVLLQAHGIPAHVALSSVSALRDPQLVARGHFVELEHPIYGKTVVQGSRYRHSETPAVVDRPAPTLGRDNDHVLRHILGYDDERIGSLNDLGVLT